MTNDFRQKRLNAALDWLALNPAHYLFPLKNKQQPLFKDNLDGNASNDFEQIKAWDTKFKGCGWGLALRKSGLIVVDIDTKPGKNGKATVKALRAKGYKFPKTFRARSPSGGVHLIYKGPHVMKGNGFGEHVDSPNYIVLPGIGKYKVEDNVPFADAPSWFYDVLGKPKEHADVGEAAFEPTYTAAEFAERLALIPVEYFDDKPKEWETFMLACTHASTVEDGEIAFMDWTTKNGEGKYAGDYDKIAARFKTNWRNSRNKSGPRAAKVGTFNRYLEQFGHADKVKQLGATTAEEDFGVTSPPPQPKAKRTYTKKQRDKAIDKIRKLLSKTVKAGCTEDEAAAFKAKAEKIMDDYDLSAADIGINGEPGTNLEERYGATDDGSGDYGGFSDVRTFGNPYEAWNKLKDAWVYVAQTRKFVRRVDSFMFDVQSFNDKFAHVAVPDKDRRTAIANHIFKLQPGYGPEKFDSFQFAPNRPDRIGGNYNAWHKSDVVPKEGDTTLWDKHLKYLFPKEEERKHVLRWLAWVYRYQHLHPIHALMVHGSMQGTGKSVLHNVLRRLLGIRNCTVINQSALGLDHDAWKVRTKLLVIEEIRGTVGNNRAVTDILHPIISEDTVHVDMKNKDDFDMDNVIAVMAFSNKADALTMDDSDRRYLVVSVDPSPDKPLKPLGKEYYNALYGVIGVGGMIRDPDALGAIAWQLEHLDLGDYSAEHNAPYTTAKKAMSEATGNVLEKWIVSEGRDVFPFNCNLATMDEMVLAIPKDVERAYRGGLREGIAGVIKRKLNAEQLGKVRFGGRRAPQPHLWALNRNSDVSVRAKFKDADLARQYRHERGQYTPEEKKARAEAQARAAAEARAEFAADPLPA